MVLTYNLSTQEAEVEGLRVQSQPGLHSEFQRSLNDIVEACLKKQREREKEKGEKGNRKKGREGEAGETSSWSQSATLKTKRLIRFGMVVEQGT
jgi:hypothetical protein